MDEGDEAIDELQRAALDFMACLARVLHRERFPSASTGDNNHYVQEMASASLIPVCFPGLHGLWGAMAKEAKLYLIYINKNQ